MNREDYLKLLAGDVTIALEICEKADEWCDTDPVGLYHAAQVLARHYREASVVIEKLSRNLNYAREEHCDPCLNGPAEGRCGREGD